MIKFNLTTLCTSLLIVLNLAGNSITHARKSDSNLKVVKNWKLFTYNFLPHHPVNDANFFNPTNVLATGIAVDYERIFISTPKLFSGVPSTVNFIRKNEFVDSPVLQAYPDWSFSTTARTDFNCSDLVLISVYRLRIDSCRRLWVLDAGVSRSVEDYEKTCPPKMLVIDLQTNQVVRRIDFPPEILRGDSLFTNFIIDETSSRANTCDDVYIYISDTVEPAIVVYDSNRDVTWRLSHPAMYPDPDFAQTEILNDRFILMDGVVGISFDEKSGIVYFQPLATDRVFSVSKHILRAGPLAQNQILQVKLVGRKSSQGIGMVVSPIDGSLIFSPMSETAIASWNPATNRQSVLAFDRDNLQFVADLTRSPFEEGLIYGISSKFHRFFLKNLNTNEINNRIVRLDLRAENAVRIRAQNLSQLVLKPLIDTPQSSFINNNYQANNNNFSPLSNYFTSSSLLAPNQPFNYDQIGLINYAVKSPFTALNQGESFPPTKEHRNSLQLSFLDRLDANSNDPLTTFSSRVGYDYTRGLRST